MDRHGGQSSDRRPILTPLSVDNTLVLNSISVLSVGSKFDAERGQFVVPIHSAPTSYRKPAFIGFCALVD